MAPSGKWIDGIGPDSSVEDATRRSLEARLSAVAGLLPRAAYLADEDIEHVHRLRVSTRRAVAALRLYRDWLSRRPARWMRKRLRRIRRAAGEARDLDVLAERLSRDYGERAAPVVAMIADKRAAAQPAIVAIADRCRRRDRFARKTATLLSTVAPPATVAAPQSHRFRPWAAVQLGESARQFREAMSDTTANTEALHEFRIRAKALRYAIELVAPAFGPELRSETYPMVQALQERLGAIQDHVAAEARLSEWAGEVADRALAELLRELAAEEIQRLDDAIRQFREWWTPERADALRHGLMTPPAPDATTAAPQATRQT